MAIMLFRFLTAGQAKPPQAHTWARQWFTLPSSPTTTKHNNRSNDKPHLIVICFHIIQHTTTINDQRCIPNAVTSDTNGIIDEPLEYQNAASSTFASMVQRESSQSTTK